MKDLTGGPGGPGGPISPGGPSGRVVGVGASVVAAIVVAICYYIHKSELLLVCSDQLLTGEHQIEFSSEDGFA